MLAMTIFATSMVLLYAASTIYHSICHVSAKVLRNFQKLDHMMIFVLIAGSYTPICLIALKGHTGKLLCILVWSVALVGIIVEDHGETEKINQILHEYAGFIIGRMGIPYRQQGIAIISVVLDAPQDAISSLSGKLGMLNGVSAKTVYSRKTIQS